MTAVQVGGRWFSEHPGDLERYFNDLIDALPDAGVECRGLVLGTTAVQQETDGKVRAFAATDTPLFRRLRSVRRAVRRARRGLPADRPRLLVCHAALYAWPLIRDRRGRPWVVHFHEPWAADSHGQPKGRLAEWLKRRMEMAVYRNADRLIVLSEASGDLLCQKYGVEAQKVTVIPFGIDLGRFAVATQTSKQDARTQFGWPADRPIVLIVSELEPRMGLMLLIEAMKKVRARVPTALCMIVGRGSLAEALVKQIDSSGLGDTVTLVGFVPDGDLPMAYRAADLTIMSPEEPSSIGLPAAESLAAGTPALVVPVGGLPEVVRGLDPQLVLPATDAGTISTAISAALGDLAKLPTDEACRDYVAKTFDWELIAARVAEVYVKTATASA